MRERLYHILVNRIPGIRSLYMEKRKGKSGIKRAGALVYLLWLNVQYYVLFRHAIGREDPTLGRGKTTLYESGSESSILDRKEAKDLVRELSTYDVISFDVFDTLLFRPFSDPTDLFYLVGMELRYPNFKQIRMETEALARVRKFQEKGTKEVTFQEIWELMERETGIPKQEGMKAEWEYERRCCFANPYMLQVVQSLQKTGKILVAASDMYLGKVHIQKLLHLCGYDGLDACFVSCDYEASKSQGSLYSVLRKRYGERKRYAHVGDHAHSDVTQARKHQMQPFFYRNVNEAGNRYRTFDMSPLTGSLYRSTVNIQLHHSARIFSREYEYGYAYGGLFVLGYCRFIHEYASRQGIEKILFLSRDGYILHQVYQRIYPEEGKNLYAYWSRLAAVKLCAGRYKHDYFQRFLYHKANQGKTLKEILDVMELSDMQSALCYFLNADPNEKLTHRNVESVKKYLIDSWDQVLDHYKEQSMAAKKYYERLLEGCKSAAAVDVGWAGSGPIALDYAVSKLWKLPCSITGIVAGTNTWHSTCQDASESFLFEGKLVSYLYSDQKNRDLWKFHDAGKNHNLYWELLLGAEQGSLEGFYLDAKGTVACRFREQKREAERIREIHRGILDFVEQFLKAEQRIGRRVRISGRDAYAPMISVESEKNRGFMEYFKDLMDEPFVG